MVMACERGTASPVAAKHVSDGARMVGRLHLPKGNLYKEKPGSRCRLLCPASSGASQFSDRWASDG